MLETEETTIRFRESIATTLCHELGHQWTGDLVTLDWWSNTWLNEGFATYFESVICDKVSPCSTIRPDEQCITCFSERSIQSGTSWTST